MGDTVVTILAIVLAAVLMFIFPLMSVLIVVMMFHNYLYKIVQLHL